MPLIKNIIAAVNLFALFRGINYVLPHSVLSLLPISRQNQLWQAYFVVCVGFGLKIPVFSFVIILSVLSFYLLALSFFDADYFLLPDSLTFWLLFWGLLINSTCYGLISFDASFYGFLVGFTLLYSVHLLGGVIYQNGVLGFGDVKLFSALGAWCGLTLLPYILFVASLLGMIVYGVLFMTTKAPVAKIAFGPCLAFSTLIVLLIKLR
ncbi:prepilin peptidase [Proteus hauseri]|uniref:prepilin peptidase n=1 Tax=Proteus hauseri TaxID=183417 RepID=UPI0032DAA7FD